MKRGLIAAFGCLLVLLVAQMARHRSLEKVAVSKGDIVQQLIARARVEPAKGRVVVTHDRAVKRVVSIAVRQGDVVTAGQLLAEVQLHPMPQQGPSARSRQATTSDDTISIKAPTAGTILQLGMVRDGGYPAATALAVIADLTALQLQVEVEAAQALQLAANQPVALFVPGAATPLLSTKITRLGSQLAPRRIGMHDARVRAEGAVRTAYATLSAEQSKSLLLGQELEARIALPAKAVSSMLPRSAVAISEGRAVVMVPGTLFASAKPITLGVSDETHVEVRDIDSATSVLREADQL